MFARLAKLAVVTALACSIGLHWGFFQSVAWVGMVINYAQDSSFEEALTKTFDGKHPCRLCKEIAKGKQSEKKSNFLPTAKKFEFSYSATVFVFSAPTHFWEASSLEERADSLSHMPAVPPPKPALG